MVDSKNTPETLDAIEPRSAPFSKVLALTALFFWLSSLPLNGLVFGGASKFSGGDILTTGWFAVLGGNFAWLANPLFFWITVRIFFRQKCTGLSWIALVLALSTFLYRVFPALGATLGLYGYGWGVVIWLLSFSLLIAAAGAVEAEEKTSELKTSGRVYPQYTRECSLLVGLMLFVVLGVGGVYLSRVDKQLANDDERKLLQDVAFKRGKVCTAAAPKANKSIAIPTGPVEIVIENKELDAYPIDKPEDLLKWGLPKVRFGNRDYYYESNESGRKVMWVPADSAPAMQLFIKHIKVEGKSQITLKLTVVEGGLVVFDQTWLEEIRGTLGFCPSYNISPREEDQPRKLILEALRITSPSPSTPP